MLFLAVLPFFGTSAQGTQYDAFFDRPIPECLLIIDRAIESPNNNYALKEAATLGKMGVFPSFSFSTFHGKRYDRFLAMKDITVEQFWKYYVLNILDEFTAGANKALGTTSLKLVKNKVTRYMLKIDYDCVDDDEENEAYYIIVDTRTNRPIYKVEISGGNLRKAGEKFGKKISKKIGASEKKNLWEDQ